MRRWSPALLCLVLVGCDVVGPVVPRAVAGGRVVVALLTLGFAVPALVVAGVAAARGRGRALAWLLVVPAVLLAVAVDLFAFLRTSTLPTSDLPMLAAGGVAWWALAVAVAGEIVRKRPQGRPIALLVAAVAPLPVVLATAALAYASLAPRGPLASVALDQVSCARYDDGEVACWYGDATFVVPGRWRSVDVQGPEYCVAGEQGEVRCGWPGHGLDAPILPSGAVEVAMAVDQVCARLGDGGVACNAGDPNVPVSEVTRPLARVPGLQATRIVGGYPAICAITTSGSVACWNAGNGAALDELHPLTATPSAIAGLEGATDVGLAMDQVCGLVGGRVLCSSRPGSPEAFPEPQPVDGLDGATALHVGSAFVCALLASGEVACVGDDSLGERGVLGVDPYETPVSTVSLPGRAVAIGGGDASLCARLDDGRTWCWGSDRDGVLPGTWPDNCTRDVLHLTYDPCVTPPQRIEP